MLGRKPKNTDIFILEAKQIHGNEFDYSQVVYVNNITKVKIICKKHGVFEQRPSKHLSNKRGCPLCGKERTKEFQKENYVGWSHSNWAKGSMSNNFDSFKVYIIKCWNDEEEFYKIGKTFTALKKRFDCKRSMPYNWKPVKVFEGTAKEMSELENRLQKANQKNKYNPNKNFIGANECFSSYEIIEKAFDYEQE